LLLFFDTETSGLPSDWNASPRDVSKWPRLVQIGWLGCDPAGEVLSRYEAIIKPEDFTISPRAAAVHGISTTRARQEGVAVRPVLLDFLHAVRESSQLIGHNIGFDDKILSAELIRAGLAENGLNDISAPRPLRCTMKESADYCQMPGGPLRYKWPTLTELHQKLFGEPFVGVHGALADAEACRRCYLRLRELGVMA
jgi:DNA polymerase III epsilon subunit-like protein